MRVNLRGMVLGMQESFRSFAIGLSLSFVLLYLILVAQFRSFLDPVLIMLAIPMGIIGVLVILLLTGTTLNVMSLMGVLMLVGIAASNSILIVDFAHRLRQEGMSVQDAVITSCRVRLRPILMTSLATIIGMIPDGAQTGHRRRAVCADGSGHHRRPDRFGPVDHIHRSGRISPDLPAEARIQPREPLPVLTESAMSAFSIRNPYFIIVLCLAVAVLGVVAYVRDAGGSVSDHQPAAGRGGDVLFGHAAAGYRGQHHFAAGALLYAGQRNGSYRNRTPFSASA